MSTVATSPCVSRSVAKVVNPLGTVTTVTQSVASSSSEMDICVADHYLHENCDEALFRPVVTVISDTRRASSDDDRAPPDAPEPVGTELIVPVVESERQREADVGKNAVVGKEKRQDRQDELNLEVKSLTVATRKSRKTKKGAKVAGKGGQEEKIESKIEEILLDEVPEDENLPQYKTLKQDFEMIQDTLLKDSIVTTAKREEDHQFPEIVNNFFDVTTTKLDLEFPEEDERVVEPLAPLEPFELKFEPMYVYEEETKMFERRESGGEPFWSDHFYGSYEEEKFREVEEPSERILSVSGSSENESESSSGGEKVSEGSDGHDEELQPLINASGGASEGSPVPERYAAEQKAAVEDQESTKVAETLPTTNQSDSKQQKKKSRRKKR